MRKLKMIDAHSILFDEPKIEFRYNQLALTPKDGLTLFGPYDADLPSYPGTINYMLIGAKTGIKKFKQWSLVANTPVIDSEFNQRLWPAFPGFKAVFGFDWPTIPVWEKELSNSKLLQASRKKDPHERANEVVFQYLDAMKTLEKLDEKIGVIICVVPDEIFANCRPKSNPSDAIGKLIPKNRKQQRKEGQKDLFDSFDADIYSYSVDFRRQLKARSMKYGVPIQIIRESTLRLSDEKKFGERGLTPLSDRMWNLSIANYYKAGGKPWKLTSARDGVCYIGIAFRRTDDKRTACCAAQMFLQNGEGIVFLGEYGPWYSPKTKQFHLPKKAAKKLLSGILETYKQLGGKELAEIFIHSRSKISLEEYEGYKEATPSGINLTAIKVRLVTKHPPRLYRLGDMPVLRGTCWKINRKSALFWGSGFKPRLATYDGWDTPIPLRIDIDYGNSPIERVVQDIYGLTKLNYNSGKLGNNQPVTVAFSDAVGEILISNPNISERKPNFKFYI